MKGPFDPHVGRKTSIVVLKQFASGRHALITSISTRSSTELLFIDEYTGKLTTPTKGYKSSYTDESEALNLLKAEGYDAIGRGSALLGYAVVGSTAGVLLATKLKDKATLPGGHVVHQVQESQWILITLDQEVITLPGATPVDQEFWKSMLQHPVQGFHYFCETADLTTPFPSPRSIDDPVPEFVWNSWLSQPLKDLGLIHHCPVLLQGVVEAADETHPTGQRYAMALISRRSRRHPGTRYIARGLNELAGPGNEIEQDLIVWTPRAGATIEGWGAEGGKVRWARASWRRGTVPIWWGVDIKNGIQAEVYVREREPYTGMLSYFRNVQKQYEREVGVPEVPIMCINLLHLHPRKAGEQTLQMHFEEGMSHIKRLAPAAPISLYKFDWHDMSRLSEEMCITTFWSWMQPYIQAAGLATGEMQRAPISSSAGNLGNNLPADGSPSPSLKIVDYTPWGHGWRMAWFSKQKAVLRFNCADSLDRTNAATCFAMLPVLQEGLRFLGVQLDITTSSARSMLAPLGTGMNSSGSAPNLLSHSGSSSNLNGKQPTKTGATTHDETLPPGWEKRLHGDKYLYIDHNTRKTQWEPPGPVELILLWEFFDMVGRKEQDGSVKWLQQVRDRFYPDAVEDYVEMFKRHGDVHASIYTGSSAMHSHVLSLVLPTSSSRTQTLASGGVGKLQNLRVAVQRRWNNTYGDTSRQQAMELFLGLNLHVHCPEAETPYLPWLDLKGALPEDVAVPGEAVHHAGGLGSLKFSVHDDRVAVTENVEDLETWEQGEPACTENSSPSLTTQPIVPADKEAGGKGSGCIGKLDDNGELQEESTFDPLGVGVVKSPLKASMTEQQPTVMKGKLEDDDLLGIGSDEMASKKPVENALQDLLL